MEDMGFADIVSPIEDNDDYLYSALARTTRRTPALGVRSFSYSAVESELSKGYDECFDDPSPAFPSFPTSRSDFEDIFY